VGTLSHPIRIKLWKGASMGNFKLHWVYRPTTPFNRRLTEKKLLRATPIGAQKENRSAFKSGGLPAKLRHDQLKNCMGMGFYSILQQNNFLKNSQIFKFNLPAKGSTYVQLAHLIQLFDSL